MPLLAPVTITVCPLRSGMSVTLQAARAVIVAVACNGPTVVVAMMPTMVSA
jgi:hypothetical protein